MAVRGILPHIPIPEDEFVRLLLQVKPTADMPRPGTHPTKSAMAQIDEEFGPIYPTQGPG